MPSRHGFDEFFGYLHQMHAHNYYTEFLWDNEKKYALGGRYSADVIAERSYDFVRRNRQHPFFLYLCTTLQHTDFTVPSLAPYAAIKRPTRRWWPEPTAMWDGSWRCCASTGSRKTQW